jgi:anti-sigma factor RsiW
VNPIEAKRVLLAYRPGTADADDSQVAEALAESRRDSRLHEWAVQQAAFQQGVRTTLREIPVPPDLRERILARNKVVAPRWWQKLSVVAAAAVIALLLGLGWLLSPPSTGRSFETYRDRMVRAVLRQYNMDIVTNDMTVIRRFLVTKNAPSDYTLPPGLLNLPVSGAGVLSWRDSRVSMVCLDAANQGTLFLFVVDRDSVAGAPGPARVFDPVSKLMTVSWSEGGRTYVLAGNGSQETLQRYWQ